MIDDLTACENLSVPFVLNGLLDEEDPKPSTIANAVLGHRRLAVMEDVKGHVVLSKGVNALQNNKAGLEEFFKILVQRKVLSKNDVHVGCSTSASHLSMLSKINKYQNVILHDRILPLLTPGYSVLYQLACLYEELEIDNDEQD